MPQKYQCSVLHIYEGAYSKSPCYIEKVINTRNFYWETELILGDTKDHVKEPLTFLYHVHKDDIKVNIFYS